MMVTTAVDILTGTGIKGVISTPNVSFPSKTVSSFMIWILVQASVVPAGRVTIGRLNIKSTPEYATIQRIINTIVGQDDKSHNWKAKSKVHT